MRVTLGWFRINSINTNVSVSNNLIVRTLDTKIRYGEVLLRRRYEAKITSGDVTTRVAVQLSCRQ